jgi:hypothetical protein
MIKQCQISKSQCQNNVKFQISGLVGSSILTFEFWHLKFNSLDPFRIERLEEK